MSAEDVIRSVLNRTILVEDWPDDERDAYRNTAGSTIKKFNAAEDIRVQKILDAVRAEQELTEVWGIKNPAGVLKHTPPMEIGTKEQAEASVEQHAKRGTYVKLASRWVTQWKLRP
jgi:hypothetical protein